MRAQAQLSSSKDNSLESLAWKRLDLIREKTVPVGIAFLTLALLLKFEFEKKAGNELEGVEISRKKDPTLILSLSSGGEDFLDGKG
jgi:hypothetical protein